MPFSGSPKRGYYHTAASTFLDYKPKVPRTVSAEMPMSATVFLEFVVPQRIETAFFCNPRASASMSQTALFAFPLSEAIALGLLIDHPPILKFHSAKRMELL